MEKKCLWCGLFDSSYNTYIKYYHGVGLFCNDDCHYLFMVNNDRENEMKIIEVTRFELMDFK